MKRNVNKKENVYIYIFYIYIYVYNTLIDKKIGMPLWYVERIRSSGMVQSSIIFRSAKTIDIYQKYSFFREVKNWDNPFFRIKYQVEIIFLRLF